MRESAAPARADRIWLLLPLALAAAGSANVLGNDFAGDAVSWVAANPLLQGISDPGAILASPYRVDVAPEYSPWRPLTSLTHALSWSMGGGNPFPYHLFDLLLHVLVTALVFALIGALGASATAAAAGAALFALHPVHVEAVAGIVGRADMLVACFALLAVLAHLCLHRRWRIPLIALCYAGALAAKESGVILPGLVLATDLVRAPDARAFARGVRRETPLWLTLLLVLAGYFVLRHAVLGTFTGADVAPYIGALPTHLRITTAIANWTTYTRLLLMPWELSADYGPAVILPAGLSSLRFWAGLAILLGGLALALATRARAPFASLGFLWLVVAVFPVSNLLVLTPVWVAERTLYLPSVAVALGAAALVAKAAAWPARQRRAAGAALVLVLVLWAGRGWLRNGTWRNSDTMAVTLIEERPESFRSAWWLGRRLTAAGNYERAAVLFARADSLVPGTPGVAGDYAAMLLDAGRPAEAEARLRQLPGDASADMGIHLVRAIARQGRLDEAAAELARLRVRFPRDARLPRMAAEVDSARAARR